MRRSLLVLLLIPAACTQERSNSHRDGLQDRDLPTRTAGEERMRIAPSGSSAVTMRSGPRVSIALPSGFTLYPGAKVVSNTLVERGGERRMLLVFETPDPVEKVMRHYRAEARVAGVAVSLDLVGAERASLGGVLPRTGGVTISARRVGALTRVEFSAG